ncbi:MAG: magnesium transporter CorA family protein [Endomicrobium sp.]|jgi:magnesium transporter|uniref:magnesium transporter CorA family protein n=1 Tax=Candidatus Endomicrobiellum cubanum TaxID=3242325 RepID=UPI0028249AF5|nr:magnesium transporter CorA family protein [Endomicrobium sp.]
MIKAIYFKNGSVVTERDALKVAEDYNNKLDLIWIDIHLKNHELTHQETVLLTATFRFHEMSIEDCLFPQYYPKIEEFENYVFGAIHGIQLKPNYYQEFEDSIYELNFFVGKGFLVTVHTEELFFLETIFERAKARPQVEMKSLENLLYNVFNKVVSSYEFTLEKIDDKMEGLEDEILEDPEAENMEDILDTKKVIFAMRKIAESQQAAYVYFTRANNNLIAREYLVYFRDIYTQCARMNQAIIMRTQMIVSLIEVYMSSVTVKLTEVMKFLTVIATIVMPVLIVSGYYGMNVVFPEYSFFGQKGSWFFAVGIMLITIIAMLVYFKKKKWF